MGTLVPRSLRKLTLQRVEAELVSARGNVSRAARALNVPPQDLRELTRRVPYLLEATLEGIEQAVDEAESALFDGLRSEDLGHRLTAAGYILGKSPAAKARGWGK